MSRFEKARVLSVAVAGAGLVQVELEPPVEFARAYARVGQYVQVAVGDSTAYFALCGDPGGSHWSLLLRPRGSVAEALGEAEVDSQVSVSEPLGAGFAWDRTRGADVFVVVAGTGFAIAPPILRARVREGAATATFLLLGSEGQVALRETLEELAASAVRITLCAPSGVAVVEGNVSLPIVPTDLQTTLAAQLAALRSAPSTEQQRRRVCVFAAGPDALLTALQGLLAHENARAGAAWCELLLNT